MEQVAPVVGVFSCVSNAMAKTTAAIGVTRRTVPKNRRNAVPANSNVPTEIVYPSASNVTRSKIVMVAKMKMTAVI